MAGSPQIQKKNENTIYNPGELRNKIYPDLQQDFCKRKSAKGRKTKRKLETDAFNLTSGQNVRKSAEGAAEKSRQQRERRHSRSCSGTNYYNENLAQQWVKKDGGAGEVGGLSINCNTHRISYYTRVCVARCSLVAGLLVCVCCLSF